MKTSGFFGIGIENPKFKENYGTLFRSAHIFGADFIFIIGTKFKPQHSDTTGSYKHLPVYSYENFTDFYNHLPHKSKLVGVELTDSSKDLQKYIHPKRAIYLLGSEKEGISKDALSKCDELVQIPGEYSLNVSVAGSIVLYDRLLKNHQNLVNKI